MTDESSSTTAPLTSGSGPEAGNTATALADYRAAIRARSSHKAPTCYVPVAARLLPADAQAVLLALADEPDLEATALVAEFRDRHPGFDLNASSIRRHRRRLDGGEGCQCPV